MNESPVGYEAVRAAAKELNRNIPELLALSKQNDPFFAGSPTDWQKAEWFADLWERFGYISGVHLRRVHYQLVSQDAPELWDGKPYQNTEGCWKGLCDAGKLARHLGYVSVSSFVDRRNPEPRIFAFERENAPGFETYLPEWNLPAVAVKLDISMPDAWVSGYEYEDALQPNHVEIWAEKSTMNDVLVPLCERLGVNLIVGLGFMSITSVAQLLRRSAAHDKPCRILYVSDHDPAGAHMPVGVGRQIEFGIERLGSNVGIKLDPVILTPGQVDEYQLPRTPIKGSDLRRSSFEAVHGTGAVELDSLEALRPGALGRVLENRIAGLRDPDLQRRVRDTAAEAQDELDGQFQDAMRDHEEELQAIREAVADVSERHGPALGAINRELEPLRQRVQVIRGEIAADLDIFEPDLPSLPETETETETNGWLYDSGRDYLAQLAYYRKHKTCPECLL